MDNNPETLIGKKLIQKALLDELCSKGLIDFTDISSVIKKLEEDIHKLKKRQEQDKDIKNIIVKIPI